MPWKKRKNQTYYYRNHRVDGKQITEYFGNKLDAVLASEAHQKAAELEKLQQERSQADLDELAALTARYDQYAEGVRIFVHATLLAHGYHLHKGQWRKRRPTTKTKSESPAPTSPQPPAPPPTTKT